MRLPKAVPSLGNQCEVLRSGGLVALWLVLGLHPLQDITDMVALSP